MALRRTCFYAILSLLMIVSLCSHGCGKRSRNLTEPPRGLVYFVGRKEPIGSAFFIKVPEHLQPVLVSALHLFDAGGKFKGKDVHGKLGGLTLFDPATESVCYRFDTGFIAIPRQNAWETLHGRVTSSRFGRSNRRDFTRQASRTLCRYEVNACG